MKGHPPPHVRDKNLKTNLLSSSELASPVLDHIFQPEPDSQEPAEEGTPDEPQPKAPIYITSSPIPTPLLHICQETRALAQKHYVLSFETPSSPPRVYFNPAIDTLYLPYWSFEHGSFEFASWTQGPAEGLPRPPSVQYIAFDLDKWYSYWDDDHLNY